MNAFLVIGIILSVGFILGQEFQRLGFPKIIGYLAAGVILNPQICPFVPDDITSRADLLQKIAIAFISFSIGGTIIFSDLKKLGKSMFSITILEAETTFFAITAGILLVAGFLPGVPKDAFFTAVIPLSLLLGALGSTTDPAAGLAVTHEYKAKGEVTSTILNVSAFDDVLGIINYSVAIVIAQAFITHQKFSFSSVMLVPLAIIAGSVALGAIMGFLFNRITKRFSRENEGLYFILILSFLTLCWGLADFSGAEEILSIMVMGMVVVNYSPSPEKIFRMLERYSEELIFLIFFTLSGMFFDLHSSLPAAILLVFFVIFRLIGKFTGVAIGATVAGSSGSVKKFTACGLVPYGGIVIGLALLTRQDPAFSQIGGILVNTVVGATIINEFAGPILVKKVLKAAGEIS
ncbi:MAG: cation:proton antiporter [Candidatus Omnitrophota bacterium]